MNSDLSDIANAMTGSLARDGQGGMTAVLPLNTAGFTYTNDLNTGVYRSGADTQAIKCGGVDSVTVTSTGLSALSVDSPSIKQNGVQIMPPGLIAPYGGLTAPSGWLLCYGQAVSRVTYADLFANIGTNYGGGNGTTTFNVPDLRGFVPAGKDNMGGVAANRLTSTTIVPNGNTLNAAGGTQTVSVLQANLPSVNFLVSGITLTNGTPTIGAFVTGVSESGGSQALQGISGSDPNGIISNAATTVATNVSVATQGSAASGGSGSALNKIQPTLIVSYIIWAGV